jgi:DNA polymerase-3 subunit gamma/tau
MLSKHAFNAMLKTLEEPPDYLKFVLATTDPQKVPPTVLSRCLQFNLRPMAAQTVQQHLGHVLEQEQLTAEAGALRLLARAARGSMRDALSLTDQAIAFGAGALTEAGVRQMLGAVDRGHAVRIVEALAAGDGAALMAAADALRALGLSAAGTLEELAALLQQLAVLQVLPEAADASDPEAAELVRLTPVLAPDETQLYYSLALHGREELALAPDEYSGLAMVLLRMLAFRPQAGHATRTPPAPGSALEPTAPSGLTVATAVQPARASPVAIPVATRPPPSAPVASSPARPASDGGGPRLALPAASLVRSAGGAAARSPAPRSVGDRVAELPADEPPPWMDAPFEHEAGAIGPGSTPRLAVTAESTRTRSIDPADAPAHASDDRRTGAVAVFIPTELGDRWEALVGRLNAAGRISAFARELAMQAQCLALDTDDASVRCHLRVERETLRAEAPRDKLQAALAEELQRPVALTVDGGAAQDSPVQREQAERARRQAQAERIIHDDPMVRALLAQYPTARLVPGSIKPAA